MMNKIKNSDSITNKIITNVNMLINPKKFENSNVTRFYKNFYDVQKNESYVKNLPNLKNSADSARLSELSQNTDKVMKRINNLYKANTYIKNQTSGNVSKIYDFQRDSVSGFVLNEKNYNAGVNKNSLNYYKDKIFYNLQGKTDGNIKNIPNAEVKRNIGEGMIKQSVGEKVPGNIKGIPRTGIRGDIRERTIKENVKEKVFGNIKGIPRTGISGDIKERAIKENVTEKISGNIKGVSGTRAKRNLAERIIKQGPDESIFRNGNRISESREKKNIRERITENSAGEKISGNIKGVFGTAAKGNLAERIIKQGYDNNFNEKSLKNTGKKLFNIPSASFNLKPREEEKNNNNFKGFKTGEKNYSFGGDKNISEKTAGGINISPNINVEINQKNSLQDFNKIWEEIGSRLNSEISASVNGYH